MLIHRIKYYILMLVSWHGNKALDEIINYCASLRSN
jgi:hypothetical protein